MYKSRDYTYYSKKEKKPDDSILVFLGFCLFGLIMFAVLL